MYNDPADIYDEEEPNLPLGVDLSRPLHLPADMPPYSTPWFDHIMPTLRPFACYHSPYPLTREKCATPRTYQWAAVMRAIRFYGHGVFEAYPRLLPSYGRVIGLKPHEINAMVQEWRNGATAVAAEHLLQGNEEITAEDIITEADYYLAEPQDVYTYLLVRGHIKSGSSIRLPGPFPPPCGFERVTTTMEDELQPKDPRPPKPALLRPAKTWASKLLMAMRTKMTPHLFLTW
jgi:hypothetical protein